MKIRRRFLAVAAAVLAACFAAGGASAAAGKVTQELEYRNIKVTLNGKALDLRNAVGDPVEPFMFGGTNYLPVRALAEALGLEVSWDGANSTVVLKEPEAQVQWLPDKGTLGKSDVEIVSAVPAWSDEAEPVVVITYNWTNNTDKRTYAMSEIREAAYQDGEELDYADVEDDAVYDVASSFKEVRPGTTVRVQAGFVLRDPGKPVEFELTERVGLAEEADAYVYRDFPLEGLEFPPKPEPKPVDGPQESV